MGIKFGDFSQNAVCLNLADFKFGDSVHVCILVGRGLAGLMLIWHFFLDRQTAKLKTLPNFPAIRVSGLK